jgi:hypothetical protein
VHFFASSKVLKRTALAAGVVALGVAAFAPAASAHVSPAAKAAINTYKSWDGSQNVTEFGCPNTTTYGQVITVPANKTHLTKFTFPWENLDAGSMVVRGEVYAWDGSEATGSAVFESAPKTIDFSDGVFHNVAFKVPSATVTPGAQYVVFASIDKDYEQCTDGYALAWGSVDDSVYPGGTFVYQNNGGDESQWTTAPWNTFGIDLTLKVFMKK